MARKILTSVFLVVLLCGGVLISKGYSQPSSREDVSNQQEDVWDEQNIEHEKIWTSQPILSDLLYKDGFADDLQKTARLSDEQLIKIKNLATQVLLDYRMLDTEARVATSDPNLTHDDKVKKFKEMGYNKRVLHEVNMADKSVKKILTKDQYNKYIKPTVSLDVISLVASSCGYYRGQIEHRAAHVIRGARGDTERARETSTTPPSAARSARRAHAGASLQASTAAPEAWHRSGTTPRSGTTRWSHT